MGNGGVYSPGMVLLPKIVLTFCERNILVIKKKLLKFKAKGREFATKLRSLEQFVQSVRSEQFLTQNAF